MLRRKRVRELWVLRAHATAGWSFLGELAEAANARLYLVIHAPHPRRDEMDVLRFHGFPVATPREIRLSRDRVALALGITPDEGWGLTPAYEVFWLPAPPV